MSGVGLERNASYIFSQLVETEDNRLITKEDCTIYLPLRFQEKRLVVLGEDIRIVGLFAIQMGKYYAVNSALAMMPIKPDITSTTKFDDEEYFSFSFKAGSEVVSNLNLVRDDTLVYRVYNEITAKGHFPWFLSYEDLGKLYMTAPKHGNIVLASNNATFEMIAASITRDNRDTTKYYRYQINSMREQYTNPPNFIPLRSVLYGTTNTTSRLIGSYFEEGVLSALTNPSEKTEHVESLLRQ